MGSRKGKADGSRAGPATGKLPALSPRTRATLHRIARALADLARADGARGVSVAILRFPPNNPGRRGASSGGKPALAHLVGSSAASPPGSSTIRLAGSRARAPSGGTLASGPIPDPFPVRSGARPRAAFAVPILRGSRTAGVILFRGDRAGLARLDRAREMAGAVADCLSREILPPAQPRGPRITPPRRSRLRATDVIPENGEQFFEKIIQASPDAIVVADRRGTILLFNAGAERISGYRAREVVGRMNVRDLVAPHVAREIMRRLRGPGRLDSCVEALRTKEGGLVTVETCTARTTYRGRPVIIGYCRDVTRQARALFAKNKELEEAIHKLREVHDGLFEQQKLAELGTFSAGIAHEIRNPLGLVRSHLLRLQGARDDATREAATRGIERQIRRTSDFIEKILSYARPTTPVRRRLDLNRTLSMATRFAAQAFPLPSGVEITRAFDPELPRILGDHSQLQEVFINLVNNAIQAVGAEGTIRLVTAREGDAAVRAEVIDTGPGVPEPVRERIFLPFFTAGKGSKGTGMGLAIARRIVEGHEGRIEVVVPPEGGVSFRVVLPLGPDPG